MQIDFGEFITNSQQRVEKTLEAVLSDKDIGESQLIAAMRYSGLKGGKRIRPVLVYGAALATGKMNPATDDFACALECMHVYSLIHDDLPSMDDDELRRGKPTCHIAYDEATAILAGDALQCLAFETLAKADLNSDLKLRAVAELARASGKSGMVLGQAIDLSSVDKTLTLDQLEHMHRHKTGALIEASVVLGGLSCNANANQIEALRQYAQAIGLAFQVQDDILDVVADTETLGKSQGADIERNKPTYVSLLGLEQARKKAKSLENEAVEALGVFNSSADALRALANYIVNRHY